jgi:type IV secretory pathway VirD2 relaxase
MPQFTKDLMSQMETDLGVKLQWAGIAHYNTGTPHAHVIIRGVDEQGKELRLSTNYLRYDLRDRAEALATNALGYRLAQHATEQREKTLRQEKFTEVDRAVVARADSNHQVHLAENRSVQTAQERQRLAYLTDLGLAKQTGPQSWELYHDLTKELRFRAANREFAPEWRKPPMQEQQLRQRGVVRAVDEQEHNRERGRGR